MVSSTKEKIKVEERWSNGEPYGTPIPQVRPRWKRQQRKSTKNIAEEKKSQERVGS